MTKMRFTLDMNCIIDVETNNEISPFVLELVSLHGKNGINVAISKINASERQKERNYANNFSIFREKLAAIGFESLELLPPIAYMDITYIDNCVWSDRSDTLEARIHDILFPGIQFLWPDYVKAHKLPIDLPNNAWRNAKCDVLALWCHIKHGGGVFVTSDRNFHKKTKVKRLQELGAGIITYPKNALALVKAK